MNSHLSYHIMKSNNLEKYQFKEKQKLVCLCTIYLGNKIIYLSPSKTVDPLPKESVRCCLQRGVSFRAQMSAALCFLLRGPLTFRLKCWGGAVHMVGKYQAGSFPQPSWQNPQLRKILVSYYPRHFIQEKINACWGEGNPELPGLRPRAWVHGPSVQCSSSYIIQETRSAPSFYFMTIPTKSEFNSLGQLVPPVLWCF